VTTPGSGLPAEWDRAALRAGAGVALVFAIPFSIAARVAADGDNSGLAVVLTFGAVLGFIIGAGCAAWLQRVDAPLLHGIATAAGTYLAAQTVFVVIRLIRGDEVRWLAVLFNLSVVVFAGVIGGLLGARLQAGGYAPSGRLRG
jgi:uncharacterized membrane protein YfcA